MTRRPLKLLAYSSAAVLALCLQGKAYAQSETITATLITSSAIDTTLVSGMDFGTWLIQWAANATPSITLTADGTATTSQTGTLGNATMVEIVDGATEGVVEVTIPAPTVMGLTRGAITDFTDAGLTLTSVSYDTATEALTTLPANSAQNVTVVAANTAEEIRFGGVVDISATPADGTHTATFNVTLAY